MAAAPPQRQSSAISTIADTASIDASHGHARLPLGRPPPRPAMVTPSPVMAPWPVVASTLPPVVVPTPPPISLPPSPLLAMAPIILASASPSVSTQVLPMVAQERQVLSSSTSRGKSKSSTEK